MAQSRHERHQGARADEDLGSSAATAESEAYVASLQSQLSELRKQLHEAQLSQRSAFDEQGGGTERSTEHAELEAQMREFDAHRALETQKLARERRVLERQAKALLMMPERKEREELQALKTELASVRNDASVKESRWKMSVERLRRQLGAVLADKAELQQEMRYLEQGRQEALEASAPAAAAPVAVVRRRQPQLAAHRAQQLRPATTQQAQRRSGMSGGSVDFGAPDRYGGERLDLNGFAETKAVEAATYTAAAEAQVEDAQQPGRIAAARDPHGSGGGFAEYDAQQAVYERTVALIRSNPYFNLPAPAAMDTNPVEEEVHPDGKVCLRAFLSLRPAQHTPLVAHCARAKRAFARTPSQLCSSAEPLPTRPTA